MVNEPKTVAEQLDAAQSGEEFGNALKGFFTALADAKHREDDDE